MSSIHHIQTRLGGIYGGSLGETGDASAIGAGAKKIAQSSVAGAYGKNDGVELSSAGNLLRKSTTAVGSLPDVRADKVEALRAAISAGTYSIDYDQLASKLLG